MMELLLVLPLSVALWTGVVKWCRYLDTLDLLDSLRPSRERVRHMESVLPDMPRLVVRYPRMRLVEHRERYGA